MEWIEEIIIQVDSQTLKGKPNIGKFYSDNFFDISLINVEFLFPFLQSEEIEKIIKK